MSRVDDLYETITRRAAEAAGERRGSPRRRPAAPDDPSPLASLHADAIRTGVPCANGCVDDAAARVLVGSGESAELCPSCVARVRATETARGRRILSERLPTLP